jgi:hypothetical protein
MRSLNATAVPVVTENYHDCYLKAADLIEKQIASLPELYPTPPLLNESLKCGSPISKSTVKQEAFKLPTQKKLVDS